MKTQPYLCYTDGSCKKSEANPGGWGVVIQSPTGDRQEAHGGATKTTSAAMELTAIREALKLLPPQAEATILTDARSAIEACSRQIEIWKKSEWRNCQNENRRLLQEIDQLLSEKGLHLTWQWVRSHKNNEGNIRADALAAQGAREAKRSLNPP